MNTVADIAQVYQGLALAGRGAGARRGDWKVKLVESNDIRNDRLELEGLREIEIIQNPRTERHLLRPYDVVVTARAGSANIALVPPEISRTLASVTVLVVRSKRPETGMGHWLWYFLTSAFGRAEIGRRVTPSRTMRSLTAKDFAEIRIPLPSAPELDRIVELVEASEAAYRSSIEAADLRRNTIRNATVSQVANRSNLAA